MRVVRTVRLGLVIGGSGRVVGGGSGGGGMVGGRGRLVGGSGRMVRGGGRLLVGRCRVRSLVGSGMGSLVRSSVVRVLLVVLDGVVLADLPLELDVGVELLVLVHVVVDDPGPAVGLLHAVLPCGRREGTARLMIKLSPS